MKGLRILIVEDQAPIALQLEDMLIESECEVVGPASRVGQALRLLNEHPVDAAVLDLNIAGELVYPVADALDARGLPYVFATGYSRSDLAAPYRSRRILQKPFSRPACGNPKARPGRKSLKLSWLKHNCESHATLGRHWNGPLFLWRRLDWDR